MQERPSAPQMGAEEDKNAVFARYGVELEEEIRYIEN